MLDGIRGKVHLSAKSGYLLLLVALLAGLVAVVGLACGDDDEDVAAPTAAPAAPAPTAAPAAPAPTAVPAAPTAVPAAATPTAAPAAKPVAVNSLGRDYWVANADETPKRGGTLRTAQTNRPTTLDRHIDRCGSCSAYEVIHYEQIIRTLLLDWDTGQFGLRPGLMKSWEQLDNNTILLHLQEGVTTHKGNPWNAELAKKNLDRARTDPRVIRMPVYLAAISTVDIVDPLTVRLNMPKPVAPQMQLLGNAIYMEDLTYLDTIGEEAFSRDPSGTGPGQLTRWIPDDRIEMERFPDYWADGVDGKPLPYWDKVVDRSIPAISVAVVELETGQLDFFPEVDALSVEDAKRNSDLTVLEHHWAGTRRPMMGLNARTGPFTDIRLRRAAHLALDRAAQAKAFGPTAQVHYFPFTYPFQFSYDASLPHFEYDPVEAKRLVCEVDPDCKVEVKLMNIAREPDNSMTLVIKQMWDAVGIQTTLNPLEVTAWVDAARGDNFEANIWRSSPLGIDPDASRGSLTRGAGGNWGHITTPGLQECYEEGAVEFDQAKRKVIYARCQTILYEDAQQGVSFVELTNYVLRNEMKGVSVDFVLSLPYLHEVWLDR